MTLKHANKNIFYKPQKSWSRMDRVNSSIKKIAAFYFTKEFKGEIITVARVETSKDLKSAKIFISIFPETRAKEMIKLLRVKVGDLREEISRQIKTKFLPFFELEIENNGKKY